MCIITYRLPDSLKWRQTADSHGDFIVKSIHMCTSCFSATRGMKSVIYYSLEKPCQRDVSDSITEKYMMWNTSYNHTPNMLWLALDICFEHQNRFGSRRMGMRPATRHYERKQLRGNPRGGADKCFRWLEIKGQKWLWMKKKIYIRWMKSDERDKNVVGRIH